MHALELGYRLKFDKWTKMIAPYCRQSGIYVFLISFSCIYYVSNASILLSHYDLGWHLAAGDLIRDRGSIPFQDPWSFTLGDKQWYNLSWLWDVIASVLFQYTSFSGLVVFVVACGAIIVGCLTSACLSSGASAVAVCLSVFFASLLYPSFPTAPNIYLAASPNTATMLFCAVFYKECLNKTRFFSLPLIMLFWVNLHGGFPLGFLIIGIFCATALLKRDWESFKKYSLAGAGCFIAIFFNPLGWHIYDGVDATLGHFVQTYITEWWSYFANLTFPSSIPGIAYISIFAVLELRYRSSDAPVESRLLSWLFLFLGLYQFRYMAFFFIFSTIPMALHIDRLLSEKLKNLDVRASFLAAGIIGTFSLPLTFMHVQPTLGLPDILSAQDVRYLQEHLAHARVLNHWNVGGILIFRARGSVPVFVDGRAATAYPDDLLHDYFSLLGRQINEAAWDAVLEKYRIDAVLWVRAHDEVRRFLVEKKGWKEEYTGLYESVYVRPQSKPSTVARFSSTE